MDVFYGCDSLDIGGESYRFLRDIPHVTKVTLALMPIVGMPIIPSYDMKDGKFWKKLCIFHSCFLSESMFNIYYFFLLLEFATLLLGGDPSGLKFRWFVGPADGQELEQIVSRSKYHKYVIYTRL